jgi:hypothetical protein
MYIIFYPLLANAHLF